MGGLEGIPATSTAQESSEGPPIRELREWVSALRKPYPGTPIVMSQGVPVWDKFNFGQNQAQAQGSMPTNFAMGISKAQDAVITPSRTGKRDERTAEYTKQPTVAMLASTCEPGWYISPFDGLKYKAVEKFEMDKKNWRGFTAPRIQRYDL